MQYVYDTKNPPENKANMPANIYFKDNFLVSSQSLVFRLCFLVLITYLN